MRRILLVVSLVAVCSLAGAGVSYAKTVGPSFSFVGSPGSAGLVKPGNHSSTAVQLKTTGTPWTWGAVNLSIPSGMKLSDLSDLSTDYKFVLGSCWGGSPRFEAWVTDGDGTTHKIFFFVGPLPSWVGCQQGSYSNTGNLATPGNIIDDSQLPGGSTEDTFANAEANYGYYSVTAIYLDADGGWAGNQTVDFDNTQVNNELFTYGG